MSNGDAPKARPGIRAVPAQPSARSERGRQCLEIDVFNTGPLTGNPLAVVLDPEGLGDADLQRIAAWTGRSETTFLFPPTHPDADYRIRIFTPRTEYPFAGHPTLGSARAWLASGGVPRTSGHIVQECPAGLIEIRDDGDLLRFATPPRTRKGPLPDADIAAIASACRIDPGEIVASTWGNNGSDWQIVQLRDAGAVRAVRPISVRDLRIGLVGFEPAGSQDAYEVRALGTTYEDPVTGSLHGSVAEWVRERELVPDAWTATQGSQIGHRGRVHLSDDGTRIWVGGRATITVAGTCFVD